MFMWLHRSYSLYTPPPLPMPHPLKRVSFYSEQLQPLHSQLPDAGLNPCKALDSSTCTGWTHHQPQNASRCFTCDTETWNGLPWNWAVMLSTAKPRCLNCRIKGAAQRGKWDNFPLWQKQLEPFLEQITAKEAAICTRGISNLDPSGFTYAKHMQKINAWLISLPFPNHYLTVRKTKTSANQKTSINSTVALVLILRFKHKHFPPAPSTTGHSSAAFLPCASQGN